MNELSVHRYFAIALLLLSLRDLCRADCTEFHKQLQVSNAEVVRLTIDISKGDVEVAYNRDGETTITAFARSLGESKIEDDYFVGALNIEQAGNKIVIRQVPNSIRPGAGLRLQFRIDVPYRTEITSLVRQGSQIVRGVTGPVALRGAGDVSVGYVSKTALVEVDHGNLALQMVADHVVARTGRGNISAERLPKGIRAETGDGDIKLVVIGPSEAVVRAGSGRIEVGGARDTLSGLTDSGDLRVQAVPHGDWNLNSNSGSIRLELPVEASFDLHLSSESGKLQYDRDDLAGPSPDTHQFSHKINGGQTKIEGHTKTGDIWIR